MKIIQLLKNLFLKYKLYLIIASLIGIYSIFKTIHLRIIPDYLNLAQFENATDYFQLLLNELN